MWINLTLFSQKKKNKNEDDEVDSAVFFVELVLALIVRVIFEQHFIIFTNLLLYHIDNRRRGKGGYITELHLEIAK